MQKKAIIALSAVFVIFLVLGIVLHSQQGLDFQGDFWRLKKDGSYAAPGGGWVRANGDGTYEISLRDNKIITARQSSLPDGVIRMDYSDGWAVERPAEDAYWIAVGGYAFGSNADLILTDMDAQDFEFAAAVSEERYPFYDENDNIIGETVRVMSADGSSLFFEEVWYSQPEFNTPERPVLVLEDGARISDNGNSIFQNADGEYLMNSHTLGRIELGTPSSYQAIDRRTFTNFLLHIAENEPERRGHAASVFMYILFFVLGAIQLLFPEKMAFFGSRWQFRNEPELSDAGLAAAKIGGAILIVGGIIMLFVGLG